MDAEVDLHRHVCQMTYDNTSKIMEARMPPSITLAAASFGYSNVMYPHA